MNSGPVGHAGSAGDIPSGGGPSDSRFGAIDNPAAGCMRLLDGVPTPCDWINRMANGDALQLKVGNTKYDLQLIGDSTLLVDAWEDYFIPGRGFLSYDENGQGIYDAGTTGTRNAGYFITIPGGGGPLASSLALLPQNSLVDDPQKRSDTSGDKDIKPPGVKTEFLTPCVQKYLSRFFGGQSLAGIQIQRDYLPPIAPSDARAFTSTGDLISFNKGEYQPNTMEGIALIGHEITHNFQARKYGDARFGVLYLGDSAVQWVRGRDAYLGNRFEKEAFAKEKEIRADLAKHGNPCP